MPAHMTLRDLNLKPYGGTASRMAAAPVADQRAARTAAMSTTLR